MADDRAFWMRFGPPMYWDASVRAARAGAQRGVVLSSLESSRISGFDWDHLRWRRSFSLQAFVEVAGQQLPASPRILVTRGVRCGSVRRDLSDPVDVLSNVLGYTSCVSAARDYLRGHGLRVSCEHGPLDDYLRRYAVAYPQPQQHQFL